jgi:hypothetical protein
MPLDPRSAIRVFDILPVRVRYMDITSFKTTLRKILIESILVSSSVRFLVLHNDENFSFELHMDFVCKKLSKGIFVLLKLSRFVFTDVLINVYYGIIYPYLAYEVLIWGSENSKTKLVFRPQALRTIFHMPRNESCKDFFITHKILTFSSIYFLETLSSLHKNFHYFHHYLPSHSHRTRGKPRLVLGIPHHSSSFCKENT